MTEDQKDCILCGRCLEVCPLIAATNMEELGPRAKHQLMAAIQEGRTSPRPAKELAGLCLGCERCAAVCPQGLSGAETVASLRARHPGWQEWMWKRWMRQGRALWPSLSRLAKHYPESFPGQKRVASLKAMLPELESPPWIDFTPSSTLPDETGAVTVFPGCLGSSVRKNWYDKSMRLLEKVGYPPAPSIKWECCGATLEHAGLKEQYTRVRGTNISAWRKAGRPKIAVFCASCLSGLLAYSKDPSLSWEEGESLLWKQSVTPLSMLLLESGARPSALPDAPLEVTYHRPCHGAPNDPDQALLRAALGDRLAAPKQANCCGMGGILQLGAPQLSMQIAATCWGNLQVLDNGVVLTGCSGCVMQLSATAPQKVRVAHWLDVIAG